MALFCAAIKRDSVPQERNWSRSLPCPNLVWDFAFLSLEMYLLLLFFLFLFSPYFCSVDACAVCIVSGHCNQSYSVLFYVIFKLLYRCINAFFNAGNSSSLFFSWHKESVNNNEKRTCLLIPKFDQKFSYLFEATSSGLMLESMAQLTECSGGEAISLMFVYSLQVFYTTCNRWFSLKSEWQ